MRESVDFFPNKTHLQSDGVTLGIYNERRELDYTREMRFVREIAYREVEP